jgi:hypothetical protein
MRFLAITVLCIAGASAAAGCRQADGSLPAERVDDQDRIRDVSRDLLNLAGGDAKAQGEFADDLKVWGTTSNDPWPPGDELAKRMAAALKGKKLTEEAAAQLARQLRIAAEGGDLSNRQVDRLQEDITGQLVAIGVSSDAAEEVADQIEEVQDAVKTRRRWWFQVF